MKLSFSRLFPVVVVSMLFAALISCGGNSTSAPSPGPTSAPTVSLSTATVDFGSVPVNTPKTIVVTVNNTGSAALTVSGATLGGANAADFSFTPNTFPVSVAAGASTTVSVTFTPKAELARNASLTITDNAAGSPHSVALTGIGTAGRLAATPASVTFASQVPTTHSAPVPIELKNTGTADLTITALAVSGTNASEFTTTSAAPPITLAPNASTTAQVTFTPQAEGTRSATLSVTSSASTSPLQIGLSGTSLDQDARASVVLSPNTGNTGSTVTVTITGTQTSFVADNTTANFGPGISVGNSATNFGPIGDFGPINVTSATSATAQVKIDTLAAAIPRVIYVRTGTHLSAATFTVGPQGTQPTANAGSPQTVKIGDTVRLDGSASTGSPVTFLWSFVTVPQGSTAALSNPSSINPSFVADKDGTYFVKLLVHDLVSNKDATNWVVVTTKNSAPVALAGVDQFVTAGSTVQLNGSGSTDVDGDSLTYQWQQVSGPAVTLNTATSVNPTFNLTTPGTYKFDLTVNDGHGNTATDQVIVSTLNPPGTAPIANAGVNQSIPAINIPVQLNGSASSDADGDPLTYKWTFLYAPTGSTATLATPLTSQSSFTPNVAGVYIAELQVTDSHSNSSVATVTISVQSNSRPVANAGPAQTIDITTGAKLVTLTGSGSSDLDGDTLTYAWSLISKPAASSATLTAPTTAAPTFTADLRGTYVVQLTVSDGKLASTPATVVITAISPDISIAPTSLAFADQLVGTTSASQGIVITNTGTAPLVISSVVKGGANASDFGFTAASQPITVAPSATTTVNATFAPTATGNRTGSLTITSNASSSPNVVPLTGKGIAPIFSASPSPLAFGGVAVGTTSTQQSLLINNTGSAPLNITALVTIGGADASSFAVSAQPGTPVPAGASTTLKVAFSPAVKRAYSATLSIPDDASGSPHQVPLSGTGTAPVLGTLPASIPFPDQLTGTDSTVIPLTISNTGDGDLVITNLTITGANALDFSSSFTGTAITVAPGATTTVGLRFSPKAAGQRSASLILTDNATGSPQAVALTGKGTAPALSTNPVALTFSNQEIGTSSSQQPITINNTGDGNLVISALTFTGGNAGDFTFTAGTLPITVAPAGSTTIQVTFKPTVAGTRSASLSITDSATGSPHAVALSGTGIVIPRITTNPTSLSYGSQLVGTPGSKTVTISNTGTGDLVVSGLTVSGVNAANFAASGVTVPFTIVPGGSQQVTVTFTPSAAGARSASLQIVDNASGSPHSVTLSGTGTAPVFGASPTPVNFGNQQVSTTSAVVNVTISNTGDGDLVISNLAINGTNASEFTLTSGTLPITVPAAGNTIVGLRFAPTAIGARAASLIIGDSAGGHSIGLSGTGTAPSFSINPPSVDFGNQLLGVAAPPTTITINNTGTADLIISTLDISGAHASDFGVTGATLPLTVNAGSSKTIQITFTASNLGNRSAQLNIGDNAGGPHTVTLAGRGTTPGRLVNPNPVVFPNQVVNTTSSPINVSITNSGTANLVITALAVSGTNASDFAITAGTLPITLAPGAATSVSTTYKPLAAGASSASLVITDNAGGSPASIPLSGTGTAPAVSFNPLSVTFPNTNAGVTSAQIPVTITNSGTADLHISALALIGTNPGDFILTASAPPLTVVPGGNVVVNLKFAPTTGGLRSATLRVTDDASGSPHQVAISGTGTAPGFSVNPTTFNFGNQNVNSTSAPTTITISNPGTGDLVITNLATTGNFAIASGAAGTVPPNGSLAVQVTFTPTASGARSGSLTITDNATGSPHSVTLSGTGTTPGFTVNPTTFNFGSQNVGSTTAATTITISNPGNGNLIITNLAATGDFAFTATAGSLPITVLPAGNTTVQVTFTPTASGARSGSLNITDNATGSPHSVALSGTGTAPVASVTPNTLTFASQNVNSTSTPQTVNVTNTGNGVLVITALDFLGANASDFAVTPGLPITVQPNGNAALSVTFAPAGPGARTATLRITHNAATSPNTVTLSGTGIAPALSLNKTSISFASQLVNVSTSSTLTISNNGTAPLTVSSLTITGTNAAEYTHNAVLPISINPGSNNTVTITFLPKATGNRTATLTLVSNALDSPHTVSLSGLATSNGNFIMPSVSVGYNLETFATASVDTPAPTGGLTVNISSSDPTKVLLSPDPSVLGQGTISVSIPQGSTSLLSGFYVQGLASSGTVQLTVSAPGYSSAVSTTTLTPSGFVLAAPPSNFSTSTLSQNTAITILPVQLNSSLAIISGVTARIRGGFSVNVPITSANTNAGDIANSPSVFVGGDTVGTAASFHPKAAGSTQISVGTPSGFSTPTTSTSVLATVTQPNITLSPVTVGANLQAPGTGVLQVAAPTGGLSVTLTSSDPTKVKLTANAAVDGSGSITLSVPAGTTLLPPFYVQGLASSGTIQVTATATGYASATGQVALAPSGFVLTGPNNVAGQPFSTTTISPPSNMTVTVMQLNANLTPFQEGTLRGGISVSVPVTSSSTGVGTISSSPVTLNAGDTNATTQFQPVTSGTATLSLGTPSIAGFSTPSSQTQVVATVSAPSISLNLAASNIGNNLQVLGSGSLTAPAPTSGLQVTITSNSPDVLVSNDASGTTAGAASTIVFVPGGSGINGRGFPLFYVQALNSTGSAQLTVSAPGWDSTSITVNLKPSGFTLSGSTQGIGQDFAIQTAQTTLLPVQAWQLNSSTLNPQTAQSVRGGLTVQVGVSSSNTGVGTVVDTPAVFTGGTGLIELTFQSNNSPGTTTVLTLTEPAGFATPVFGGQSATQLTAHVN